MGVPSAARWLLSWLPESHESESLEEWSRSNMYLIPSARLPSSKQRSASVSAEQRYNAKWPPPRPCRLGHGLSSGSPASPYGRFGKSFPPMLEAPLERREEEESEQQDDVAHRGLKRAHSSSGVAVEQPKRRSLEQPHPETALPGQQQQLLRQAAQQVQDSGGGGVRRSTDPGSHIRRPTQPIPISGAGSRPPTPVPPRTVLRRHVDGAAQQHSTLVLQQDAALTDPVVLSQLLDDTVQLLGHTSLISRQESAPAIMVRHSCAATVNALNASLSSNSLAAQAAAASCMDSDASPRTPDQQSPMQRGHQHYGGPFVMPPTAPAQL